MSLWKSFVNDVIKPIGTVQEPPPTKVHPLEPSYAYSWGERVRNFPWRFHWRNDAIFRIGTYTAIITLYFASKLQKPFNTPEYKEKYFTERKHLLKTIHREHWACVQYDADHEHFKHIAKQAAKEGKYFEVAPHHNKVH